MATWPNYEFSLHMTQAGATDRLLSFWELKEHDREWIEHYVMTGMLAKTPNSKEGWDKSVYIKKRLVALIQRARDYEEAGMSEELNLSFGD